VIQIKDLCIQLKGFALKHVNININKQDFFILVGPTGSGKTLLVESIAGITPISSGKIIINGHDMTHAPPEKREVGIVYQDYALFPHMTVMENIRYGLLCHKKNLDDQQRLHDLMVKTDILKLSDRKPKHLSGGEKQRVALIRALAVNPSVVLLDEPLSALDPCFRDDIQKLLKKLHKEINTTFLMVTHNFAEALFLGDRGAVLNNGEIEQTGPVQSLFNHPRTHFVAQFMGFKNILEVKVDHDKAKSDHIEFEIPPNIDPKTRYICFRGEDVHISIMRPSVSVNTFLGEIEDFIDKGPYCELLINSNNEQIQVIITKGELIKHAYHQNKTVFISIPPTAFHFIL